MATVDESGTCLEGCFSNPCNAADKLFGELKGVRGDLRNPDRPAKQQSAEATYIPKRRQLAAEGKEALINSPLIVGAYEEFANATVGKGRRLKPEFNKEKLGLTDEQYTKLVDDTKQLWREDMYSKRKWIDQEGDQTLAEMEKQVLKQTMAVGETYTLAYWFTDEQRPFRTALGIIDDDRVRTPSNLNQADQDRTVAGHLKGDSGRTAAYYIHDYHRNDPRSCDAVEPTAPIRRFNEFGREQVIHVYNKKMPGLSRGLSDLTSAFEKLKCLEKYKKTQLDKAIMQVAMGLVVKSNDKNVLGQMLGGGHMDDMTMKKVHALAMKKVVQSQKLINESKFNIDGVKAIRLLENEEAELLTANTSATNDQQFIDCQISEIARATGHSRATITQDFEASYSAARAVMISFYRQVDAIGYYIVDDWLSSVYAVWLEDVIQSGRLVIPTITNPMLAWMDFVSRRESYCAASFSGPAREEIDAAKTAQAAKIEQEIGTFCFQDFFDRYKGIDYKDAFRQQFEELKAWNENLILCGYEPLNKKEAMAWLRPKFALLANAEETSEAQEIIDRDE